MGIIIWIVFGAIVGWIASVIMGTGYGVIVDIIIGVVGAIIGGWIMSFFGYSGVSGFNVYSFLVAILGSVALLAIVKILHS